MPAPEARRLIADYAAWEVVSPDAALVLDASLLESSHSISFWDALIVEAARRAGADVLLTEDLQHGQSFGGITIQNPFHGLDEDVR
ncbi:PIN domain-containing protein [Nocardioides speluncae]|uniref:PIN domain-containing protein n=1 Tax=Nocardioides speluncae TaxID=2670337 RepID=UPI00137B804C|nr:PIN domain-containing protein [Nocardioides speluncae]